VKIIERLTKLIRMQFD